MTGENPDTAVPRWIDRVLASLTDGLALVDGTEHVVLWNPQLVRLLGWPAAEMVGRRSDEMAERIAARATTPQEDLERLTRGLASADEGGTVDLELLPSGNEVGNDDIPPVSAQPRAVPGNLTNESGLAASNVRYVSVQFFAVRGQDGPSVGTGILFRDTTRERVADASKSQLLSTVSHELRTPLASIKGFATTLLRQDVKWDETTQRDFLKIIEEEADRLTEIIDNLLDMSQIEAGALRIEKTPTQLRTLFREVVDEMRMRTEAHWFVMDLPSELPQVSADPRRIRQVLHNLLENAVKYSKGGQITLGCDVKGDFVVVSVSDQGEGIPPKYLDRIFERFFQIDGASTRRVGGSGLGLSISRGIIAAHGGRIWAESAVGQGSTFRFTLPIAYAEVSE